MLLLALPGRAADLPPAGAASSRSELRQQISAFVEQPRFSGALWGVKIASLDTGRILYEHHADRRLSPASNCKLYTAALALARLGGDYRIVTPILATAVVGDAGELKGDIIVGGRGDPSWNPRRDKRDFWDAFGPVIAVLEHAGVRHITGDLVADATYFRCPPHGAGWTADDLNDYYGAEISAVTLEDNFVDLRITPAASAGSPCSVELLQPLTGLVLENRTATTSTGGERVIRVQRLPGENVVRIFGGLPVGGKEELTEATVPRPAEWFAVALKEVLARRGIRVEGRARSVRWPEPPAAGAGAIKLGEIASPPLRELVGVFMKSSQNLKADLVFAHLGELRRTAETPAWRRSDELAVEALQDFLRGNALRADEVIFEEGSGLSRNNLTTAAAIVRLLEFMAAHREKDAFAASLPVAGVDGTLRKRMKGTPAEGNVRAKTGTLRWASALSGYATSAAGERLVFSLMLNRNVAPPDRETREDLDDIAVMLARYRGRD
jgi:D-alanyl-D-alanine carboxypeptidase/D-alanyl-D-alanine-endopeptidase (penicillin-binding protein 4)